MSIAAPTIAPSTVHLEIPGFLALSERGPWHPWDTCAIVAEMDALHACPWGNMPLSDATVTAAKLAQWRSEYLAAGRFTPVSGTTLGNIHWHLLLHAPHIAGYIPYSATPDLTALHTFVKSQSLQQNPIIIEVANAQALPDAEQGVAYHFVCLGGIDSTLGYLVANGDTLDALNTTSFTVPTHWATWQQLVNAKICGAIALERSWTPPPPPPPLSSPIQLIEEALTALSAAKTALGG